MFLIFILSVFYKFVRKRKKKILIKFCCIIIFFIKLSYFFCLELFICLFLIFILRVKGLVLELVFFGYLGDVDYGRSLLCFLRLRYLGIEKYSLVRGFVVVCSVFWGFVCVSFFSFGCFWACRLRTVRRFVSVVYWNYFLIRTLFWEVGDFESNFCFFFNELCNSGWVRFV